MHTQRYEQKVKERFEMLDDPNTQYWFDRGVEAYGKLYDTLGEAKADELYEAWISPEDTCKDACLIMERLWSGIANDDPAAFTRMDRNEQSHPGIS